MFLRAVSTERLMRWRRLLSFIYSVRHVLSSLLHLVLLFASFYLSQSFLFFIFTLLF